MDGAYIVQSLLFGGMCREELQSSWRRKREQCRVRTHEGFLGNDVVDGSAET
jgi:hypothetical protein